MADEARATRIIVEVVRSITGGETGESQPCDKTYGSFEYGTGVEYGTAECNPDTIIGEVDTPARDLVFVKFSEEFVVNAAYLNEDNWSLVDATTGAEHKVVKVLAPMNGETVINQALLVVERHIAGVEYTFGVENITTRGGSVLALKTVNFFARDAKANSMMAATPKHFSLDAKTSIIRHVLQAIALEDDLIGSK